MIARLKSVFYLSPRDKPVPGRSRSTPTVAHELELAAIEALDEAWARFPIDHRPQLEWRGLRVSAGLAFYELNLIRLSCKVLSTPDAVRNTTLHEYAHLLAYARKGRLGKGHGAAWQQAMRDLGLEPTVRHNYPVTRSQPRQRVEYRCIRCGETFTRTRRLPRNRHYFHRTCGGTLKLVRVLAVTLNTIES